MSTWTDEKHEAARARCEAATAGPWEVLPDLDAVIVLDGYGDPLWEAVEDRVGTMWEEDGAFIAHARADLADALDEIERMRALTTITDDMVERACQVYSDDPYRPAKGTLRVTWETLVQVSPAAADDRRSAMRAALEAALNPPA